MTFSQRTAVVLLFGACTWTVALYLREPCNPQVGDLRTEVIRRCGEPPMSVFSPTAYYSTQGELIYNNLIVGVDTTRVTYVRSVRSRRAEVIPDRRIP